MDLSVNKPLLVFVTIAEHKRGEKVAPGKWRDRRWEIRD
jgi:hypothetical protein